MTYPDPYNDRINNPHDPYNREWGSGGTIVGIVATVLIAGMIAYGASMTPINTATGPSTTTGQGGAPAR